MFKSKHTLRGSLMKVKNRRPHYVKKDAVYELQCRDCGKVYIGEPGQSLQERVKEHKYAVRKYDSKNGIVAHTWTAQHAVDWSAARVKITEHHLWKRKTLEHQAGTRPIQPRLWTTVKPHMATINHA